MKTKQRSGSTAGESGPQKSDRIPYGRKSRVRFQPRRWGFAEEPTGEMNLTVGTVARNLNRPRFHTEGPSDLRFTPQVRSGIACHWWENRLTVAVDADLTRQEMMTSREKRRRLGGGVNLHPASWLCLRRGVMRNFAGSNEDPVWTGGLGFGLKWFRVDLAAQVSTDMREVYGERIPRYAAVHACIISKWK